MVTRDPSGARKLDKSRATGRIDGMQALAMAIGVAMRDADTGPSRIAEEGFMFV